MGERIIFKAVKGGLNGEEFVFEDEGLCLIGRSSDSALRIPKEKDMRISRRHCLLILDPPNIRIRDLGSRNGTYVNGERLDAGTLGDEPAKISPVDQVLKHGDEVSLGETSFQVDIPSMLRDDEDKATPPPGTKVIKLSKPTAEKKIEKIVKARPVDTGFFSTAISTPTVPTSTSPMTEAIPRVSADDPMEQTVIGTDVAALKGKPIALSSPKKPGGTLTLKAKAKKTAPAPPSAIPASQANAPAERKRPVVLKGKKVEPKAGAPAPKPLKAKIVRKPSAASSPSQNPEITDVLDVNELADDTALGEDYKRMERSGKRVAKFKIKKPKK